MKEVMDFYMFYKIKYLIITGLMYLNLLEQII